MAQLVLGGVGWTEDPPFGGNRHLSSHLGITMVHVPARPHMRDIWALEHWRIHIPRREPVTSLYEQDPGDPGVAAKLAIKLFMRAREYEVEVGEQAARDLVILYQALEAVR